MALAEGKLGKYTWAAFLLLVSIALFFIYPADVILTGNQYIYFFWGMKNAGIGYLANDFLAQEADPFPLFSLIVTFTETYLGKWLYYVLYWLVGLVYVVSLFNLAKHVFGEKKLTPFWVPFATLFLVLHATPLWSYLLRYAFNIDLRWLWDNGVATQGLLMGYFQPSSMGVLLLLSVERFAKGKTVFAAVLAALAGVFHANYLLLGCILVGVYAILQIKDKKWLQLGLSMALALILAMPYAWYVYQNFTTVGMSADEIVAFETALEAVRQSNPHLDPKAWLNVDTGFKLLLMGLAVWMLRGSQFFKLYLVLFVVTVLLSLIALLSGNVFFINLAPWRLSVVLVPIATVVLVYRVVEWLASMGYRWVLVFCISLFVLGFFILFYRSFGFVFRLDKSGLVVALLFFIYGIVIFLFEDYPRRQVFLVSSSVFVVFGLLGIVTYDSDARELAWERSWLQFFKSDFDKKVSQNDLYMVPPDRTKFRLNMEVPVYVDNNLYFSRNLADWKRRKDFADWFYCLTLDEQLNNLDTLKVKGITCVSLNGFASKAEPELLEEMGFGLYRIK